RPAPRRTIRPGTWAVAARRRYQTVACTGPLRQPGDARRRRRRRIESRTGHRTLSRRRTAAGGIFLRRTPCPIAPTISARDPSGLAGTAAALTERTRLLVVETISNPMLRVADLAALAKLAHHRGARLLVDNTFASPAVCRPIEFGADLVMESITKIINGHSD